MSSLIVYGTGAARVILRDTTGADSIRLTFQTVTRSGLELVFTPLGVAQDLGNGANFKRGWSPRRFRASLNLTWEVAASTRVESWEGSAWGAESLCDTADAVRLVHNYGWLYPCLVQPHLDKSWTFEAWPDPDQPFALQDLKGVAHADLALGLISRVAVDIPWRPSAALRSGLGRNLGAYLGGLP